MNRRRWILAGAGAGAAAAGLGWQLRREQSPPAPSAPGLPADALWQASFTRPDGSPLAMAALRGTPLVLNFWATWCPPCLKEMPEIDRFARQFAARGGRVVGLAVDSPGAVRAYLLHTPVSYIIGMAGFEGTDLSRKLGNTSGALPFTAALNRRGELVQRRLGETSFDELVRWSTDL